MLAWRSPAPGIDRLVLERGPRPAPGPQEAVIAVRAAALNFSDVLMLEDRYQIRPPRPFTPGQEVAGVVVATGDGSRLRVGQLVASKVVWGRVCGACRRT
ncbi:MAG: alcohol dehydrogenase catalytic domain-containing protein [Pseudomonadota bacterium]